MNKRYLLLIIVPCLMGAAASPSSSSLSLVSTVEPGDQSLVGLHRLAQDPAQMISSLVHMQVDRLLKQGEVEAGRSLLAELDVYNKGLSAKSTQAFLAQKSLAQDDIERNLLDMHRMGKFDFFIQSSDEEFEACCLYMKAASSTFWEKLWQTNFEQLAKGDLNALLPMVLSLVQEKDAEGIKKSFELSKEYLESALLSGISQVVSEGDLQAMRELQCDLSDVSTAAKEVSDEFGVVIDRQIAFLKKIRLEHQMQQAEQVPKVSDVLSQLLANSKDPELTRQLLEQLAKK